MRRWWVTLALLLSLGINLGLLAAVAAGRWADRREAAEEPPPPALGGDDREIVASLGGEPAVEVPEDEPLADTSADSGRAGRGAGPDAGETTPPAAAEPGSAAPPAVRPPAATQRPMAAGAEHRAAGGMHPPAAARPGDEELRHRIRPHGPGGPAEPPIGRLADHLGLGGERRERFVALQRRFLRVHLEARRERIRLGAALRQELMAEEPDGARIDSLVTRLGETYLVSERATAEVVLESRKLLDDDQRATYLRFLQRLREGGPREGPGPGGRRRHR